MLLLSVHVFIKMDRFELMAAQLLLHLLPERVEWCDDYCETLFVHPRTKARRMQPSCLNGSCYSDGYYIRIFKLCLDRLGLKITKMISKVWIKFSFDFLDTQGVCSDSECDFHKAIETKQIFVDSVLTGFTAC